MIVTPQRHITSQQKQLGTVLNLLSSALPTLRSASIEPQLLAFSSACRAYAKMLRSNHLIGKCDALYLHAGPGKMLLATPVSSNVSRSREDACDGALAPTQAWQCGG